MNLSKNKFFLGILAFLLIVNLLVISNLDYFYTGTILSFIFLITIPGLLIMLMLKIREVRFWEYLVYTIGLSVSFIMFAGLAVNWILPWLHITNKCNLSCTHCLFGRSDKGRSGLSLNQVSAVYDETYALGTRTYYLTGGEPMIHPDFKQICSAILNNNDDARDRKSVV